jgi:hypothetical protein
MRFLSAVGLTVLMLTGCAKSEPVLETATAVQTAPTTMARPITEPIPATSPPTAPPTTAAPPTGPTTVPVDAAGSTIVSGAVITEDEAAIKLVVEKVITAELKKNFDETFDPAPFSGTVTQTHLFAVEKFFQEVQRRNISRRPGKVLQVITHQINVAEDRQTAEAVSCDRNDIQVWDNKGTSDPADDKLEDGALGIHATGVRLVRRNNRWLVNTNIGIGVEFCDGIF